MSRCILGKEVAHNIYKEVKYTIQKFAHIIWEDGILHFTA